MDRCYGSGVVMVTSVPYQCLVALAASTSAALCTYVTESTQVALAIDSLHLPVLQHKYLNTVQNFWIWNCQFCE